MGLGLGFGGARQRTEGSGAGCQVSGAGGQGSGAGAPRQQRSGVRRQRRGGRRQRRGGRRQRRGVGAKAAEWGGEGSGVRGGRQRSGKGEGSGAGGRRQWSAGRRQQGGGSGQEKFFRKTQADDSRLREKDNNMIPLGWLQGRSVSSDFQGFPDSARLADILTSAVVGILSFLFRSIELTTRKSAAGATCQNWVVHRPASGEGLPTEERNLVGGQGGVLVRVFCGHRLRDRIAPTHP